MDSFLTRHEIEQIGFKTFGKNLQISRNATFYGVARMEIGDNVRIDDFCMLSGKIKLGCNIHISSSCLLYGAAGIDMGDFSGLSPRSTIYSTTDDFSGNYLVGPMISLEYRNVISKKVIIKKFVQVGANSVVMPGTTLNEGCATGAFTFVNKDLNSWSIYIGIPARFQKEREKYILELYKRMK